jgi:hypothetical protein
MNSNRTKNLTRIQRIFQGIFIGRTKPWKNAETHWHTSLYLGTSEPGQCRCEQVPVQSVLTAYLNTWTRKKRRRKNWAKFLILIRICSVLVHWFLNSNLQSFAAIWDFCKILILPVRTFFNLKYLFVSKKIRC